MNYKRLFIFFTLIISFWVSPVLAKLLLPEQVPDPLKPWINWVLKDNTERGCPFIYNQFDLKYCNWPGQLALTLSNTQGNFAGFWQVDKEGWVFLPGDERFWPQKVGIHILTLSNETHNNNSTKPAALVIAKDNRPALFLKPGRYEIQGQFNWDFIPEQLRIPDNTGLIRLNINNIPIATPAIKDGMLWLKNSDRGGSQAGQVQDKLDLQVFRHIIDDVPLQVQTRIELDVAGTAREVKLSQALLKGFTPMRLDSPLPARLEADGQLLVQMRPGHWQLNLLARQPAPLDSIVLQAAPNWPSSEIWVFNAQPALRVAEVDGLNAIDPTQTNLPGDWQSLPAYRINAGQAMHFKVVRRGNPEPESNKLTLTRQLWLDFDGRGYTLTDRMSGRMTRDWRLNVLPETEVGKVSLNEQSQLITQIAGDAGTSTIGFEVRQGKLNVQADSRYNGAIGDVSVTGWQQTFQQVNTEINLPPGWRLLAASGVDNVPDSWVTRWTLLDLFMVLIAALAIAHLWHFKWGLFALLSLVLIWHEPEAPRFIWLNLLAVIALLPRIPPGKLLTLLGSYRKLSELALVLVAIPFMLMQVRTGLFPQLEMPWQSMQGEAVNQPASVSVASSAPEMAEAIPSAMPQKMAKIRRLAENVAKDDYYATEDKQIERIDPLANVQTGPGLPEWQWHKIHLAWNGSVDSQQRVKLWYLSPTLNGLLSFLRVVLITILALLLFGRLNKFFKNDSGNAKPPFNKAAPQSSLSVVIASGLGLLLSALMLFPAPAKADFPPQSILDELKTRLSEPPECLPACAEIAHLQINITPENLQLTLQMDAQESVAIPLPAQQSQWLPEQVVLDGVAKAPLLRDAAGQLWVQVTKGRHQLIIQGKPPAFDKFSLTLPLKPHRVTVNQTGWEQTGVHEHGLADSALQFTRVNKTTGLPSVVASTLPPLFRLERTLQLGLDWRVNTRIIRLTPADSAAILAVPLLAGESVVSAGLRVEKQQVLLNIDATQTQVSWDSVLEKAAHIDLVALPTTQWTEVWRVDISPIWHLSSEGLAPIHPGQPEQWAPEWRPWPGETLRLKLTRPEAVNGQTLTINYSQLTVAPANGLLKIP